MPRCWTRSSSERRGSVLSFWSDWNHHQEDEVDDWISGEREDVEEMVVMEREWQRVETERRESRDERVGGEWVRTMGGGRVMLGTEKLSAETETDTASGGEREDVGSVDRVRLSRNGGGRDRLRVARNESGSRASAGRVIGIGSVSASVNRASESEDVDGGEWVVGRSSSVVSQRRTGVEERGDDREARMSEGLSRGDGGGVGECERDWAGDSCTRALARVILHNFYCDVTD